MLLLLLAALLFRLLGPVAGTAAAAGAAADRIDVSVIFWGKNYKKGTRILLFVKQWTKL